MAPESPRIAELRRRVEADPSSIAFAQLAEEYRRVGNFEAAEQCCRTGLTRHPGYLSARVTLGRTLIELNNLDEAEDQLEFVLKSAPDNLAAIRGMAEIQQRQGRLESALDYYRRALPLARHDPEIEENVRRIRRDLETAQPKEPSAGLSFKEAQEEFLAALNRLPLAAPRPAPAPPPPVAPEPPVDFDRVLESLGVPEHQPPPVVVALLSDPAVDTAALETAPPEVPLQSSREEEFANLERSLRSFDPSREIDTAPLAPSAPGAPEDRTALLAPIAPLAPAAPEDRIAPPAPGASEDRTAPLAPVAPLAPAAPEEDPDREILAELESWLAAIQR